MLFQTLQKFRQPSQPRSLGAFESLWVALPFCFFMAGLSLFAQHNANLGSASGAYAARGDDQDATEAADNSPQFNAYRIAQLTTIYREFQRNQRLLHQAKSEKEKYLCDKYRGQIERVAGIYNTIASETDSSAFAKSHLPLHLPE